MGSVRILKSVLTGILYLSHPLCVINCSCVTRFFCAFQELRELTKLDGVSCLVRQEELELSRTPESLEELRTTRPKNRIDALLHKVRRQLCAFLPDRSSL